MSDGYNAYVFIGNELKSARFKDTIHQVCMSHANNKFVKAGNQGGEPVAVRFSNFLKRFFSKEHVYDEAGLTPEERLRERQSLETKELLIELRSLLDSDSVIVTVKLHGSSIWNFIGTFFKNIFNRCRDYVNMVPDKIALATSQC